MNFRDQGIIIAKSLLKENTYVVTLFTKENGLYSGLLKQYSQKKGDSFVPGNLVDFFWSARLHEHLGSAKCELIKSYSSYIICDKAKLYSFNSLTSLIKKAFYEREPHNKFFPILLRYLEQIRNDSFSFENYIHLELAILEETGHALNFDHCAASGCEEDLYYVSPKSGQAVSREAGAIYADKLLILPQFLVNGNKPTKDELKQAFALCSYFLNRYILHDKPLKERLDLIGLI